MKKIILIEDRFKRQELFTDELGFSFEEYFEVLDNITLEDFDRLADEILHNSFSLTSYDIIICHKSVQIQENNDSNSIIISRLKEFCKNHQKTLILFSGGIAINYYDNSEFELLELNSKTFYSKNLSLFLDAVKSENEDTLMLCYGEKWKQNIVANALEKANLFLFDIQKLGESPSQFQVEDDLYKIDYEFYELKEKSLEEIKKFKQSLESYFFNQETKNAKNYSLLIHHDNICSFEPFKHIEKLNANEEIDIYISEMLQDLEKKDFEMIFIKDNLSTNYLELLGLRVAYHIRLSYELGKKRFVPIVIVSDFSAEQLNRFDKMANILFTPNIYLAKNTKEDIEKYQSIQPKEFSLDVYNQEFLEKITIEQPKDYLSHHSIANEWSIYRWAEFLRVEDSEAIKTNKAKIENMLYFKYLKAKFNAHESQKIEIKKPTKKGKVLLIDDEWSKGWKEILQSALQQDGLEFKTFEYDYKDKSAFNLIVQLKHKELTSLIEDADVIILDLRLLQSDHENEDIDTFTGIKLLEKIHEINAGIQVIMLTATTKSTILEKLYEKKILGYIKKEHPDDTSIDTVENINKFVKLVDEGLERQYLKQIWNIQNELLRLNLFANLKFSFEMDDSEKRLMELKNTISKIFETLDSNISKPFIYVMLTLFKCLEIISEYFIYEKFDRNTNRKKGYWFHDDRLINSDGNASVNNKIKSILGYFKIQDKILNELVDEISCTRNYEIHPGEIKQACQGKIVKSIDENHIKNWFKLVTTIIEKIN